MTTSSFAALIFGHDHTVDPKPYTEDEWNEVSTIESGQTMHIYRVSKRDAERAGWKFVEDNASSLTWDLVTINPPIVCGPWLPGYSRPNDSSMLVNEYVTGERGIIPDGGMGFIDVRDVARGHICAMEAAEAKGRYLMAAGSLRFTEMAEAITRMFPSGARVPTERAPGNALRPEFDCSKARRDLGWEAEYSVEDCIRAQITACANAGMCPNLEL